MPNVVSPFCLIPIPVFVPLLLLSHEQTRIAKKNVGKAGDGITGLIAGEIIKPQPCRFLRMLDRRGTDESRERVELNARSA